MVKEDTMRHRMRVLVFACDVEDARPMMKLSTDLEIAYFPFFDLPEIQGEIKHFKPKLVVCKAEFLVDILSAQSRRRTRLSPSERASQRNFLSSREEAALEMLIKGRTNEEIAKALHLSLRTVKRILRNLCERLHVTNRTELAGRAVELSLLKRR